MKNQNAQAAVKNAISFYAESLGVSFEAAVDLYKTKASTRECIDLMVLLQADKAGLRKLAAKL